MELSTYWQAIADKARAEHRPFLSLAPMEAVTNAVFRQVVDAAAAPDVINTEFVNAISVTHPKAKFAAGGRLYVSPDEPVKPIVQLWGNEAEPFRKAAFAVKEMGYEAIDINMGCPDATVIKNHGGSDLIRHPESAAAVIAAAKEAGLPVSVKTRLGYSDLNEFKTWIPFLLKQDVQVLTIHVRTRQEMSKVAAHYEYIDELVKMRDEIAPNTLLAINGDVSDRDAAEQLALDHPGIDGVMIGRGIFNNPFAFENHPHQHTPQELIALLKLQLDLFDQFAEKYDYPRFPSLKRFFKIYVKRIPHSADLRTQLMDAKSTDEVRQMLADSPITNFE
ncbi:tRNA-dihydrouridine synthase [Lentilactobacillus kribbianus]|uniref:tRNA-dihydrouridine synthase n=1 Tax=Lentilactobacillus kribbianus TaxID=2729622 RepID=UPI001551FC74